MSETAPVSVIIPCYHCIQTLARAVASVAAQTVLPVELILVDDGSADTTRSFLYDLRNRYEPGWIKLVLLDQNVGAASARNAGWDCANGRYVAFLDADDSWHPNKIQLQYEFMRSEPGVAVCGHGHDQLIRIRKPVLLDKPVFRNISAFYVLLKNPFITPSFMVRSDLPIRFLAGRRHMEDHLFLMHVTAAGLRVARTPLRMASIYKNIFGDAGLSADLWIMQRCELQNYELLNHEGRLSKVTTTLLKAYSWIKFVRRYVIVSFRRLKHSFGQKIKALS